MARGPQCFKVDVEFENDIDGKPAHEPLRVAVSRNEKIRTADDAVAHCLAPIGKKKDGTPITLIHYKDLNVGLFFSLTKCVAVRPEPYDLSEAPTVRSIHDLPAIEEPKEE